MNSCLIKTNSNISMEIEKNLLVMKTGIVCAQWFCETNFLVPENKEMRMIPLASIPFTYFYNELNLLHLQALRIVDACDM